MNLPDQLPQAALRDGHVRTFHPRRGRMGVRLQDARSRLGPLLGVSIPRDLAVHPVPALDLIAVFGRNAPVVLEIGSGMGETTAAMAAADSGRDYLAVEVHTPGIANLLALVEEQALENVRVAEGDALDLLGHLLAPGSLDAIHLYFPDPWPKPKHHKRRIVAPEPVALMRSRLRPGGTLHCATDWAPYAAWMLEVLSADPGLRNTTQGYAPRPAHRPTTKFERRGMRHGHEIFDLVFTAV